MRLNDITRGIGLEEHGIQNTNLIFWTMPTPPLYEQIIVRGEGLTTHLGAIAVKTGHFTGRVPNDKFIVDEPSCHGHVNWGKINRPLPEAKFNSLYNRLLSYLHGKDLFVQDCFAGASPAHRLPIRIITERAWHSLFARNMFIQATEQELIHHRPIFTVIDIPSFHAVPSLDGTNSETFIIVNFAKRVIVIGGTSYAGEIKKSIFTILNYLLPLDRNVLSMHCSANIGEKNDVAIFFGLSGTGKTTLSADPKRRLIGDDEHGWNDDGIFNFEGGCYAKVINLSKDSEPEIYATTERFGTILENVAINTVSRRIDLSDGSFTENTRGSYHISSIPNAVLSGMAGHPTSIVMLTCDAFGVLPPIARLTSQQALFHFLSGYTAKIAGTETGITKPEATFSTCFGAPFMTLHPSVYAKLLGQKVDRHGVTCWLVNTGWNGGPYGLGNRIEIAYSRAMINAAIDGSLVRSPFEKDPFFGLSVPTTCPGVPSEILNPRTAWADRAAYDASAKYLVKQFRDNFSQYREYVQDEVARVL